jgi:dihydropteroate synthase
MRTSTAAAIAAVLLTLSACSSDDGGNVAACKKAMEKQFEDAIETGAEGSRPAACISVDDATLRRLVDEIMSEGMDDIPTPSLT